MLSSKFSLLPLIAIASCIHSLHAHADEFTHIKIWNDGTYDRGSGSPWEFYKYNEKTGDQKLLTKKMFYNPENQYDLNDIWTSGEHTKYDAVLGKLQVLTKWGDLYIYDEISDSWSQGETPRRYTESRNLGGDAESYFLGIPNLKSNSNGNVSVGIGENTISVLNNGIGTDDGIPLVRNIDGAFHIGENSLITVEEDGRQKLYARDAYGKAIPIDITEGSDLLINGTSVMGSINDNADDIETNRQNISTNAGNIETNRQNISTNADNIETNRENINDLGYGVAGATALTAALSSLPTAADDAPFSCGVGTGGYSSRLAVGIGCASRLSDRLSVNVGGSHVFGGSSSYGGGSLDTVAARGGFVFKLGTIHKRSNIDGEELQSQLDELKRENSSIREENRAIRDENKELIARLERLEAIALGRESSITRASLK